MKYKTVYADTVEKKKDDAKELVAILNKIPEERVVRYAGRRTKRDQRKNTAGRHPDTAFDCTQRYDG